MEARHLAAMAAILCGGAALSAVAMEKDDRQFLKDAIHGNYAEIKMGQLAEKKGGSEEVKSFGRALAEDHRKANTDAIEAADRLGIKPPTGPTPKQHEEYRELQAKSGADFDRAFTQHAVKDHRKDIEEYQEHDDGTGTVAEYARQALPVLKEHQRTAAALAAATATPKPRMP